jgi:Cof subfamily protein (haloacid dehalogenase superfamily)
MTQSRAIFVDIDGTYASRGVVPDAHVDAVRAARAAGHLVFLCTGRPASALPPSLTGAGFDGVVGAAGAYVDLGGDVLADVRFPADLARRTIDALDAHGTLYILETPDGLYAHPGSPALIERVRRAYLGDAAVNGASPMPIIESEDLHAVEFGKVVCFRGDTPLVEIAREIGDEVAVVPTSIQNVGDGAGEVYLSHVNKAVGIRVVMERLGLDRHDVVAFGDGLNDLEMLEFAGTAVAIEGADPRVLAVADRTTAGPESAGLAAAFADLGLIGA